MECFRFATTKFASALRNRMQHAQKSITILQQIRQRRKFVVDLLKYPFQNKFAKIYQYLCGSQCLMQICCQICDNFTAYANVL